LSCLKRLGWLGRMFLLHFLHHA